MDKKTRKTLVIIVFIGIIGIGSFGIFMNLAPILLPNPMVMDPISPSIDTDGNVEVTWNEVTSQYGGLPDYYHIYRSIDGGSWVHIAKISGTNTLYTDSGLASGEYRYRGEAQFLYIGFTDLSNIVSVTVDTTYVPPTPPSAPHLTVSSSTSSSIQLSWTSIAEATQYWIYRRDNDGPMVLIKKVTTTSYSDISFPAGTLQYVVRAFNVYGLSPASNRETVEISVNGDEGDGEGTLPVLRDPSIVINDGASTTDSLVVTLTLSCENAEEMCFQLSPELGWSKWEPYSATKIVTLPLDSDLYPQFQVSVKFKADPIVSDAIFDEITYKSGDSIVDDDTVNYTLIYGVISGIVAVIGIILVLEFGVFKKKKKRGKR